MTQNTSIYWKTPETAQRAKELADAGKQSVSALVSKLVDAQWMQLNPEPPINARCPTCGQETTFVFVAYWQEQSDLYRCSHCQKITQYDAIVDDGQEADDKKNGGDNE